MCHGFTQMIMKEFKQVQIKKILIYKTNSSHPQVERLRNNMCVTNTLTIPDHKLNEMRDLNTQGE